MFIVQIIGGSSLFLLLAVGGMAEDMARALTGSHHEQIAGEPAGMARIRQQIFVASRELITHRQQCDVLWMRLLGLRGELEALVTGAREAAAYPTASSAAPALGRGNVAALPPPPMPAVGVLGASLGNVPHSLTTVESFQRIDTGNISLPALTASEVGMPAHRESAPRERAIPVKAPPTTSSRPQPGNYAASSAETTELPVGLPLGIRDLRTVGQHAMPMGIYSGPAPVVPKPPPPVLMGNPSLVVPPTPVPEGRQPPSSSRRESSAHGTASRGESSGNPPVYQTIAHLRENAVRADGSRRPEQLLGTPPGLAPVIEVIGSVRSSISGIGAVLPHDNVHIIRGIYIRGLDFQITERQFLMEFSRFGEITAVSFPRDGHGRPAGYAMIEYGNPNQAAAAIFGLHGWCIGDRELEVTLMHRRIENANTRGSFGPRSGSNVWNTGD